MSSDQRSVSVLAPALVRRKVAAALRACGAPPSPKDLSGTKPAAAAFIIRLPRWVARVGALSSTSVHWIWCEPRPDADPETAALGQIVVDVPPGRYIVEALDPSCSRWIARESATGGPLVCGLPFLAGPILLRVRSVGPAQRPDGRDD